MTTPLPPEIFRTVQSILLQSGYMQKNAAQKSNDELCGEKLNGDGSNRQFWRVCIDGVADCIVVGPEKSEGRELQEASSGWKIGNHLRSAGVPVPELFGFDETTGLLVCEDLGDTHLHSFAITTDFADEKSLKTLRGLYHQTLDSLVVMQCSGRKSFNPEWCWDTPVYDKEIMLERESGYFVRAFWQKLLGKEVPDGLNAEFEVLAAIAAEADSTYFLHRDFQSRNVMVQDGKIRIIDFQGGRLGPLAYDLASLLLDPYANLPLWFQEELYEYYVQKMINIENVDRNHFHREYISLALQRNLQIIGAFSYLSNTAGKNFFRGYIHPAIASLQCLLQQTKYVNLPILTRVSEEANAILSTGI